MAEAPSSSKNSTSENVEVQHLQSDDSNAMRVDYSNQFLHIEASKNSQASDRMRSDSESVPSYSARSANGILDSLLNLNVASLCTNQCKLFAISIINEWLSMRNDLIELEKRLEDITLRTLHTSCNCNTNCHSPTNLIRLPMRTMDEFNKFCDLLQTSKDYKKYFNEIVHNAVFPGNQLRKSLSLVLKRFMTSELASEFTTQRSSKAKRVLKRTAFYQHLSEYFMCPRAGGEPGFNLSPLMFLKAVSKVILNSRDWDGNRRVQHVST